MGLTEVGVSTLASGWEVSELPGLSELPLLPPKMETPIMMMTIRAMIPIIIIIFKFFNQNFRFSFPACCSNCDAPCCKASALSSSSESFWSLSNTFSTFVRIIPTTSSTCAWVCWSLLWAAICCGVFGPPWTPSLPPGPPFVSDMIDVNCLLRSGRPAWYWWGQSTTHGGGCSTRGKGLSRRSKVGWLASIRK